MCFYALRMPILGWFSMDTQFRKGGNLIIIALCQPTPRDFQFTHVNRTENSAKKNSRRRHCPLLSFVYLHCSTIAVLLNFGSMLQHMLFQIFIVCSGIATIAVVGRALLLFHTVLLFVVVLAFPLFQLTRTLHPVNSVQRLVNSLLGNPSVLNRRKHSIVGCLEVLRHEQHIRPCL